MALTTVTFWLPADRGAGEDYRALVFPLWIAVAISLTTFGGAFRRRREHAR